MNEQIVKLFMQSVDSKYIPLPIEDHIPSWAEKFAELIVKECAIIALREEHDPYECILKEFGITDEHAPTPSQP